MARHAAADSLEGKSGKRQVDVILSPMTKVQLTYRLSRPLSDLDLKQVARVHAVYGILAARLLPSGNEMFIEYDASRLSPKEVRATLEAHGIPVT